MDGAGEVLMPLGSTTFVSFESWRDNENLRELKPKFATPLVTLATSEVKKLIVVQTRTLTMGYLSISLCVSYFQYNFIISNSVVFNLSPIVSVILFSINI
jgi:hypothetical protein